MKKLTPQETAKHVYSSDELLFNPYKLGTPEHKEFGDELLRLTAGVKNEQI